MSWECKCCKHLNKNLSMYCDKCDAPHINLFKKRNIIKLPEKYLAWEGVQLVRLVFPFIIFVLVIFSWVTGINPFENL